MVEQRNIVITGIQAWDIEIGSNCKNIAREFAKNHRVLYVNSAIDRISAWKRKTEVSIQERLQVINGKEPALREVEKNLWVLNPSVFIFPINWMPGFLFKPFNWLNNFRFAGCIIKAMDELGFTNCSLFTDSDFKNFRSSN